MQQYKYISLANVIAAMLYQISVSIPYAKRNFKTNLSNEQLFYMLKSLITYKKDPHKNELLQSVKTFCEGLYWGKPYMGDCDCFTIFSIAIFIANNRKNWAIVLVGNEPNSPRHVYAMIDGKSFDLTNDSFNVERPYKYKQVLNANLWPIL